VFMGCHLLTIAQVTPADSSVLNYRLIGFAVPEKKSVTHYEFEISELTDKHSTTETPVLIKKANTNRLIATVPQFGKFYKWKVNYYKRKKIMGSSATYSFTTGYSQYVDTSGYRLRVTINNMPENNMYFFADGTRVLYDLEGNALWYLPDIAGVTDEKSVIRDIKATSRGTITFLTENNIYEISYNGKLLWQGPDDGTVSGGDAENYHHEFTRLSNGHYMACGNENYWAAIPDDADDKKYRRVKEIDGKNRIPVRCGTLIEYDTNGKVVWYWKSSQVFGDSFLLYADRSKDGSINPRTHLNGFYFDEKNNHIYLSFRDINSIVKIAYPSGKKIATYGQYGTQATADGKTPFYGQHCCRINRKGELYFFNNNTVDGGENDKPSSVMIVSKSAERAGHFDTTWAFSCDMNDSVK
ncbi:MAG: aryl-sulfate sulfotransferase, partial [Taibaiella sp.]|nr:aryl-sulfate sulfotransferase [Taibaiella sp.]